MSENYVHCTFTWIILYSFKRFFGHGYDIKYSYQIQKIIYTDLFDIYTKPEQVLLIVVTTKLGVMLMKGYSRDSSLHIQPHHKKWLSVIPRKHSF